MKKNMFIYFILSLVLFIPRVYAFTYELDTGGNSFSVKSDAVKEIKVSLKNVQGTNYGISSCSLNIHFDGGVLLDSKISTFNSWTMMTGKFYLFDTGNGILDDSDMFSIPVKVNDKGMVKLTDIQCSDGETNVSLSDKDILFTIASEITNNIVNDDTDDDNNDNVLNKSSNCNLSNILLSEGSIKFDTNVMEYNVNVSNLDDLKITPVLEDENSTYVVIENFKNGKVAYEISVKAQDGSSKVYTVYVNETTEVVNDDNNKGNTYVPIFIVVICLLVLINIFRIIKKKKK